MTEVGNEIIARVEAYEATFDKLRGDVAALRSNKTLLEEAFRIRSTDLITKDVVIASLEAKLNEKTQQIEEERDAIFTLRGKLKASVEDGEFAARVALCTVVAFIVVCGTLSMVLIYR